jgi:hypothetical protein
MNIPAEEEKQIRKSIEIANENISNICGKRRNKEAADKILSELNI